MYRCLKESFLFCRSKIKSIKPTTHPRVSADSETFIFTAAAFTDLPFCFLALMHALYIQWTCMQMTS